MLSVLSASTPAWQTLVRLSCALSTRPTVTITAWSSSGASPLTTTGDNLSTVHQGGGGQPGAGSPQYPLPSPATSWLQSCPSPPQPWQLGACNLEKSPADMAWADTDPPAMGPTLGA
jgi:hypothetical protein